MNETDGQVSSFIATVLGTRGTAEREGERREGTMREKCETEGVRSEMPPHRHNSKQAQKQIEIDYIRVFGFRDGAGY